jgi:hypothetical protein
VNVPAISQKRGFIVSLTPTFDISLTSNWVNMAIEIQTTNVPQYHEKPASVCALETVDFSRLLSQEPEEVEKLLHCCQTQGFFYLDLQGIDGRRILDDEQQLLQVMRKFFNASAETKNEIGLPSQDHG